MEQVHGSGSRSSVDKGAAMTEHYLRIVNNLTLNQLLKLQEKLLDEEDDFIQMYRENAGQIWRECWDIVERRIQEIS